MSKNLVYGIHDKPQFSKLIIFAIQQLLAIIAATIAVPAIVGNGMSASAALFGAGVGGMAMAIGKVIITAIACALILGILVNLLLNKFKKA